MTNEEAIEYIEKWKTDYSVDAKDREVLSMAIKALEQQPKTGHWKTFMYSAYYGMNDEKRFCSKCGWNDCDYGCTCPPNEEVYQCPMYMHYHPDEVIEFEKAMEEWATQNADKEE